MPVPWQSNEKRNFIFMRTIVTDIVSDGLRTIFKQEWDTRYQATLGAWDNTARIAQELYNKEKGRRSGKEHLPKYLNGNVNEWDCTVLFDAILYSNSIGQAGLNPTIAKEVDNLRKIRNKTSHLAPAGEFLDHEFENDSEAVRKSFLALRLSTKKIDEIKTERKLVASFQILPPQPTHEVIPRTARVSEISDDLDHLYQNNNGELTSFYISGNPGCGKSQLAREIGDSHFNKVIANQTSSTFVMTLNAENLDTLLESYGDFARRINCPEDRVMNILNSNDKTEVKIRSLRTQIATRIEIYKNWLIIVDNVENLKLVSPLLPERNDKWKDGQVLITTQESSHIPPSNSFTGHVSVSRGLDENESCELLAKLSGTASDHPDMLKKVAKELDCQPLALAAAAVYIQQVRENVSPEFSWEDYLRKLEAGRRQLTEDVLHNTNPAYSLTMTTAVRLAVEKAAESDVVLNHTFHFLALASNESLPLEIAINYVLSVDHDQDKEQVGLKIKKCSLILPEVNEVTSIRLHRVVHDAIKVYAKDKMEELEIVNNIEVAARSFYQFKDKNSDRTLVPHLKAFHDAMITVIPNSETSYPENISFEFWEIFSLFGQILSRYGEFYPAKYFHTTALEIYTRQHGDASTQAALLYSNCGRVDRALGDLQQAKQYHEKALNIYVEQLGSNHVAVAMSYNNLGTVYQNLGDLQQAKKYYEKAINIRVEQLGSNHVDVAMSYKNLGTVYQNLGDLQQAKQYYEKALNIEVEQLGSNHVVVAASYNNLGTVYQALGDDLQQAKQYHEKALNIRVEQFGSNNVNVAMSYNNLGLVYEDLGDLQQAKQNHEKALNINVEQLGSNHVNVAKSYNTLGNVYKKLGDLQQAKQYHEKALNINVEQLGSNHVNVATSYHYLGSVYEDLGDLQQAKQYHEKALKVFELAKCVMFDTGK